MQKRQELRFPIRDLTSRISGVIKINSCWGSLKWTRRCSIKSAEPTEGHFISGGQLQEPAWQLVVKYVEDNANCKLDDLIVLLVFLLYLHVKRLLISLVPQVTTFNSPVYF
jgi:hypothetical protein